MSISVLPWLTFAFCIIAPFSHSRSDGMTTDIDSLAPGLEAHVLRLGIGTKRLQKTCENPHSSFRCTHFSIVDSVSIAVLNITSR
jgi:hypothetical protein